jgi:hypothetical protein
MIARRLCSDVTALKHDKCYNNVIIHRSVDCHRSRELGYE